MQCKSEGVGNTKCIFRRGGREAPTRWWWLPCYRLMVALSRPWDRVGWYDDNPDTHRVLFICIQMLAHMTQWTGRTLRQQKVISFPETLPSGSPQVCLTLCLKNKEEYSLSVSGSVLRPWWGRITKTMCKISGNQMMRFLLGFGIIRFVFLGTH